MDKATETETENKKQKTKKKNKKKKTKKLKLICCYKLRYSLASTVAKCQEIDYLLL